MEKVDDLDLRDILIEIDSLSVVKAFNKQEGVPWSMNTIWHNCMHFCREIRCIFTNVLREGNLVLWPRMVKVFPVAPLNGGSTLHLLFQPFLLGIL